MSLVRTLETLAAYGELWAKKPVEAFVDLETAETPDGNEPSTILVAKDGSMVTVLKVDGRREVTGRSELDYLLQVVGDALKPVYDRPGVEVEVWFGQDPDLAHEIVERQVSAKRNTARAIGLDLDDVLDEEVAHLSKYVAWEGCYFVCWTRPGALPRGELDRSLKRARQRKWVRARDAQYPWHAVAELRARHKGLVTAVLNALTSVEIKAEEMEVHAALADVRAVLYPHLRNAGWRACLPGDKITARVPSADDDDLSDILWPSLRRQLCVHGAERLTYDMVRLGNRIWTAVDVMLAPQTPKAFQALLNRLKDSGTPFRISFRTGSGGLAGQSFRKMAATVLAVTNRDNKIIKDSIEDLYKRSGTSPIAKLRISLATWAPVGEEMLLESRVAALMEAVDQWGYCQSAPVSGDPLQGIMASAMGLSMRSTAPAAPPPLEEMLEMLPWQRPSSPYAVGSLLLRSTDGKMLPYQPGGGAVDYTFDNIVGPPGRGKSLLMQSLNLATILRHGVSKLPFIAMIDIGFSSEGLISLLREALPADRRHEVAYYRLKMDAEHSVNPFDTQLGCRWPTQNEKAYLRNLLTALVTPAGSEAPYDGMTDLIGLVLKEMYRWRSDEGTNSQPERYIPGLDPAVDEALATHGIKPRDRALWWEVVDLLFDAGDFHGAGLAQRYAVPVLRDAIEAARQPQVRDMLERTRVGPGGSETVIDAFTRYINGAIDEFPILAGPTKFDIGGTRVCSLDLQDVAPQGGPAEERQSGIMYMLARHVLVHHWWLDSKMPSIAPKRYRAYHHARVEELKELPKRLNYDELHRTPRTGGVRPQIQRDGREGRKWNVQIACASQLMEDFDTAMVDLATANWILGSGARAEAVEELAKKFSLGDTAKYIVQNRLTGPNAHGAPLLLVLGAKGGRFVQYLVSTQGPLTVWALSTTPEDVSIRGRLYQRLDPRRARRALAKAFPGGSARLEVERRKAVRAERGSSELDAEGSVIEEIVNEVMKQLAAA